MLDAAGRKNRAIKAANVAAKNRAEATRVRDQLIVLAFKRLTGQHLSKSDMIDAIRFLQSQGKGVNSPTDGTGALLFLSRATGLTKQRIWAIISKK
jgi:hypothetical protein